MKTSGIPVSVKILYHL